MLCSENCPRGTKCQPISNVIATDDTSFVCVGLHNEEKEVKQDIFRHCFKSDGTDSMFDYDEYDLISVISVMTEALLLNILKK
jgi:hypothetical protein